MKNCAQSATISCYKQNIFLIRLTRRAISIVEDTSHPSHLHLRPPPPPPPDRQAASSTRLSGGGTQSTKPPPLPLDVNRAEHPHDSSDRVDQGPAVDVGNEGEGGLIRQKSTRVFGRVGVT